MNLKATIRFYSQDDVVLDPVGMEIQIPLLKIVPCKNMWFS